MIILPSSIWDSVLTDLRRGLRRLEHVAFLDGIETDDYKVVTTTTIPKAKLAPRTYTICPAAMAEAGKHLFEYGLVRIAQVHSHPSAFVEHSPYDDEMAYSRHEGAMSIVLPHYAKKNATLESAGVHVYQSRRWIRIDPAQISDWIRIVPSFLKFNRRRS